MVQGKLSANTIEAKVSHSRHTGHDIIIPQIPLILSNSIIHSFLFLCTFAMTINKSQGQTFKAVVVDMNDESYGMLYVALSRVGSPDYLTLLVRKDTRHVM